MVQRVPHSLRFNGGGNCRMLKNGCLKVVGICLTFQILTLRKYSTENSEIIIGAVSPKMSAPALPMTALQNPFLL